MRKITIIEHVSLDGVIQAPGGPEEDPGDGFGHGGWAAPFHDDAAGAAIALAQGARFDLLLGRATYDIFARYWPDKSGPMANSLNAARKYVATHRPDSLEWGPAEALGADLAGGARRARATAGPDIVVWGSSTVIAPLLAAGLVDGLLLLVFPVLLGKGKRIFSGPAGPRELALVKTTTTASGIVISAYRPVGPLRTGTIGEAPVTGAATTAKGDAK